MTTTPTKPIMPDNKLFLQPTMSTYMITIINKLIIQNFDHKTRTATFSVSDLNRETNKGNKVPLNSKSFRNMLLCAYSTNDLARGWVIKFRTQGYEALEDVFIFIADEN